MGAFERLLAFGIAVVLLLYSVAVLISPRRGARWFGWALREEERMTPRYLRVYRVLALAALLMSVVFMVVLGSAMG